MGNVAERWERTRVGYLNRAPGLIAGIALLLGVLTVIDALFVGQRFRVHAITRIIPVAAGLRKRKRRAWQAALVASGALTVAHIFRAERRYGEAIVGLVLIVLLVAA